MNKLDEVIKDYQGARQQVLDAKAALQVQQNIIAQAEQALRDARATLEPLEKRVRMMISSMRKAADRVSPILHADVAGVCGKEEAEVTSAAAE